MSIGGFEKPQYFPGDKRHFLDAQERPEKALISVWDDLTALYKQEIKA